MLALLRALDRPAPGAPDLGLSAADRALVHELYGELESDIARPFFRVTDLAQVDAHWGEWIDWFRPRVQDLQRRLLPLLTDPGQGEALLEALDESWQDACEHVAEVSEALAETFRESLRSGLAADRQLLERGLALAGRASPALLRRKEYASIGFGLAFLLLLETLERAPDDAGRVRFLVLKLKRMAAVSWATTQALFAEVGAPVSVDRGTIYRLDFEDLLPDCWEGEPAGERYVVVVSPRWLNDRVQTVLVAPTTASQVEARSEMLTNVLLLPDRTATGITRPSVVQLHLLYGIHPMRLGERVGRVTCSDALDELVRCAAYAVGDAEHWVAQPAPRLRGATG